jgi:8-oxo-dGTP diphosphatase
LEQTAARELFEETGLTGLPLTLIGVFSEPGRDPRGWTVSAAYGGRVRKAAVIPRAGDDAAAAAWWRIDAAGQTLYRGDTAMAFRDLAFDHAAILAAALAQCAWDA